MLVALAAVAFWLLLFASENAHAIGDVSSRLATVYACSGRNGTVEAATPSDACNSANKFRDVQNGYGTEGVLMNCDPVPPGGGGAYCRIRIYQVSDNVSYGGYIFDAYAQAREVYTCPANSTAFGSGSGSGCACNKYFLPNKTGDCVQYTCPPSGEYSAVTQPDQKVANAGDKICTGGCGYTPSSWKVGNDGQIWATWPFKSTGSFCQGAKDPAKPAVDTGEYNSQNPAPVACPANQCPGQVNGTNVCVPCRGTSDAGSSTAASAPGSGGGDTTTTKQTECNGVSCTTTTTTRDSAGTVVSQVQEQKPQESFCTENPGSPLCKKSSFGGQCAATSCEGDAVQCAIAADQYRRNCQWFDDPGAAQLAADAQGAMNGESQPLGHPGASPEQRSISFADSIDQMDRLAAGCPVDVAVNVAGRSLTIPFSSMCANLNLVGNLMIGFCMFVAALIVFRN